MKERVIAFLVASLLAVLMTNSYVSFAKEYEDENVVEQGEQEEYIDYQQNMGEMGDFEVSNCPNYFQQDYKDIAFGNSTLGESGNLVTCLASLETYYLCKDVSPETFVGTRTDDCIQGTKSLNANNIERYAEYFGTALISEKIDYEKMAEYVRRYNAKVLLRIPHSSVLGKQSSYILITGITKDGFYVVDPNKDNIKYATKTEDGYIYDAMFLAVTCGNTADMYIFY